METKISSQNASYCRHCGLHFDPVPKTRRYCSIECSKAYYRAAYESSKVLRYWDKSERECLNCLSIYAPKYAIQKYCTPNCAKQYHNNRFKNSYQSSNWQKNRVCECGLTFQPRQPTQRYCSADCRKRYAAYHKPSGQQCSIEPKKIPLTMGFKNEHDFAEWFKISCSLFGVEKILKFDTLFPDARFVINGKILNAEIEYYAPNFTDHGHDPYGCDLIISYIRPIKTKIIKGVPVFSIYTAKDDGTGFDQTSFCLSPEIQNKTCLSQYTRKDDILQLVLKDA